MKFGVIDFDLTVKSYWDTSWNKKALLNIGDAAEYLVIEQLYSEIGIKPTEIVRISISQLQSYRGEQMIVGLNIALDSYVGYNDILEHLSPDIVPVFLGMSFTETKLNQKQIDCLRKYAPIGCRDERSYLLMKSLNVPCYLNGCMASVLKTEEVEDNKWKDKIIFVDVPYGVCEYIPEEIKDEVVFLNQEIYCNEKQMTSWSSPKLWSKSILQVYASKPKLIVTSRFHGAVLAIANDIPAIVTLEKYTFRFSWIQNYYPVYTEDNYNYIDWSLGNKPVCFAQERGLMHRIAVARLQQAIFSYRDMEIITELQKNRQPANEGSSSNQVLYYKKVWREIQEKWNEAGEYLYSFWGVNDNSKKLYSLITEKYPKAKLVSVYDMYKEASFNGINSKNPVELAEYKDDPKFYVIVSAYLASRVSQDIFDLSGFPKERSFLCRREFVEEHDL